MSTQFKLVLVVWIWKINNARMLLELFSFFNKYAMHNQHERKPQKDPVKMWLLKCAGIKSWMLLSFFFHQRVYDCFGTKENSIKWTDETSMITSLFDTRKVLCRLCHTFCQKSPFHAKCAAWELGVKFQYCAAFITYSVQFINFRILSWTLYIHLNDNYADNQLTKYVFQA